MSLALQKGSIFARRYRVVRRIASGSMGAVYDVVHLETDRHRALKVMHAHVLESTDLRERFKQEAKVAAHINSEFIVDVFDAGVDDDTHLPFIVMELLQGEEIGKRLKRLGKFPPGEVLTLLHQTSLALDKMHRASIVHRDLKPENLFLTKREDGSPHIKVLDFGVAKVLAESGPGAAGTRSVGTPFYMAPEQFAADSRVSPESDIFALGMIAYTFLVGEPYWASAMEEAGNVFAFSRMVINGPEESASVRAATQDVTLPPAFDEWFAKATAVDPSHRFSRATLAVSALADVFGIALPTGRVMRTSGDLSLITQENGGHVAGPTHVSAAMTRAPSQRSGAPYIGILAFIAAVGAVSGLYLLRSPGAATTTTAQTAQGHAPGEGQDIAATATTPVPSAVTVVPPASASVQAQPTTSAKPIQSAVRPGSTPPPATSTKRPKK
jgi:serine/threonine-protein kinase